MLAAAGVHAQTRDTANDLDTLCGAGIGNLAGIWSDGDIMWAAGYTMI